MEDTFKPLNIPITEEMVEWNFNQIDTDHSGRISFEEYLAFIRKYNSWSIIENPIYNFTYMDSVDSKIQEFIQLQLNYLLFC